MKKFFYFLDCLWLNKQNNTISLLYDCITCGYLYVIVTKKCSDNHAFRKFDIFERALKNFTVFSGLHFNNFRIDTMQTFYNHQVTLPDITVNFVCSGGLYIYNRVYTNRLTEWHILT